MLKMLNPRIDIFFCPQHFEHMNFKIKVARSGESQNLDFVTISALDFLILWLVKGQITLT
jgi:hypothetical protein